MANCVLKLPQNAENSYLILQEHLITWPLRFGEVKSLTVRLSICGKYSSVQFVIDLDHFSPDLNC
jgi:hypothetical protein